MTDTMLTRRAKGYSSSGSVV